ncbi:hypothetical protein ACFY93_01935 [Streptomyces sp. NPDC008313]|uniref:hypothetical protein n=1 Tax=Streptomyces sp. NPDC008313 TaxID=3364826 RepID=UPI0036E0EADC
MSRTLGSVAVGAGNGAALLGVSRTEGVPGFEVPLTVTAGRRLAGRLASLPGQAGSGKVVWDVSVRPSRTAEPIRLGRVADDIVDRKRTDKYPKAALPGPSGEPVDVRPFFTVTNDLALSAG